MIVLDVGCARYGGDYSIERLIEEFHPDVLYGFDPNQGADEYPWSQHSPGGPTGPAKATRILIRKEAAWIRNGTVRFVSDGLNSWVSAMSGQEVPCVDLAEFIRDLPSDQEIVLKIDAEGSEYDLLPHLIQTRTDELLKLAWVEWHTRGIENAARRREAIEEAISCEIREWRW